MTYRHTHRCTYTHRQGYKEGSCSIDVTCARRFAFDRCAHTPVHARMAGTTAHNFIKGHCKAHRTWQPFLDRERELLLSARNSDAFCASHPAVHCANGNDFIIFSKRKQFTQLAAGYAILQLGQQQPKPLAFVASGN